MMAAGLDSSEFEIEFKKMNNMSLFNDTAISTNTDTNKDLFLAPVDCFQTVARGCVPFYTYLERADVFEAMFEYVKVCEVYIYFDVIYIVYSVENFS